MLADCGASFTSFDLPTGAPTQATQLALNASRTGDGPIVCVNARDVAVNAAVGLDVCQDDAYERWRVIGGSGIGPIVSTGTAANNGTYCLSVASNAEGSPVRDFVQCLLCTADRGVYFPGRFRFLHWRIEPAVDHYCSLRQLRAARLRSEAPRWLDHDWQYASPAQDLNLFLCLLTDFTLLLHCCGR